MDKLHHFRRRFSSPSAAAAVIHGGHANDLIAWKNKNGALMKLHLF
jgi:hypothetical protein